MEGARRAETSDVGLVAQLRRAGRGELSVLRGGVLFLRQEPLPPDENADLLGVIADPDRALWVGTLGGHVVGYGLGHRERLDDGGLHGVLDEVYVDPQARGVGVGEALFKGLLEWFVTHGCDGVDAMALPGDRAVKSFLESSGFKARLLVLYHPLET